MDEEKNKFDRARRLLSRVMARLVQQAFLRWKMYCRFERIVKELTAVVDPVADVLEKLPENRTPTDVQRLMPLVSQIEAYRGLHQPVRELLASYLQLAVLSDRTELPRGPADNTCLFSIVYGSMTALLGDPADQALASIKTFAANQCSTQISPEASSRRLLGDSVSRVLQSDSTFSLGAGGAPSEDSPKPPGTPKAVAGEASAGVVDQQQQQPRRVQGAGVLKVEEGSGSVSGSVGQQQSVERVSSRLWRTVIEVISKLNKLQKAQAMRELAAQHAAALEDMALSVAGRAAAAAGGKAAAAALAAATAGAGGGARAGAAAIGMGVLPAAAAEEGYLRLLPALAALRTQVIVIRTGQSFSGRELLCQEEAGLVQDVSGHLDLPGRAVASVVPKDSLVAVVFVSREVYHRAMAMQSEISVRRAVDCCCRLPFLRHTPLKELYRLSRHLQEVTFHPGEVVLHQGRENGFIYFLVSGEVQVVLDLPDTTDPRVLAAAMAVLSGSKLTPQQAQSLAAHASGAAAAAPGVATGYSAGRPPRDSTSLMTITTDGITTPPGGGAASLAAPPAAAVPAASSGTGGSLSLPSFGVTRRIVLGRRGSGVVLGDDLLREKRLTVGVVATSRCVCLGVSPQRFTMCCDPLTLRLFHKLRIQHSATALFTDSLVQQEQRTTLGAMFREAVLNQSYGPAALKRAETPEPKAWKAPSMRPEEIAVPADQIFQQQSAHKTTATTTTSSGASGGGDGGGASSAAFVSHHSSGGAGSARAAATSGGGGSGGPGAATSPALTLHGSSGGSGGGSTATGSLAPGAAATVNVGPPRLYGGLTVSLVQGLVGRVAESGSMVTFLQRIKASEADALALLGGSGGRDGQLGPRDLDLSQQMKGITAQPQRVYTDMHEAACMAVIKVELAPGQLDVRLDPLAQVLDDIVVQWSDLAHRWGLQLVRWRTHDFFLVTPLDTASSRGGKRSRVRIMADTLLSMAAEFRRIVAQNEIPHLSMCAGLAIGGLFSSYDSGHFLVHCSGQAYTAAQHLCKMACEESHWQGTLLVADAVAQALSRTHNMAFTSGGSVLVGAVGAAPGFPRALASQPTGRSMTMTAAVEGEEDDEPVSQGTRPYFKRGGDGGGGSRRLLLNSSTASSTGHTAYFIRFDPDAAYLDDVDPHGGETYSNGVNGGVHAAGSNRQHATSLNHRKLPQAAAMPSSLPHLHHQPSSTHTSHLHHPHHQLTQQPTGSQQPQQRILKRRLSASLSVMTSGTSISAVAEANGGGGGGGGGSPRSPRIQHHLRHTTMRLAPIGSTANSVEGGGELGAAQEESTRYDDLQHHNQQQGTRRATGQSEPRVSFHARHSLKPRSGDGGTSRMEETGGRGGGGASVNGAGLLPVGSSVATGTSSPQRVDTLRRPNGSALRLTANANRRERIAAGSAISYRQQLLQEVSHLRHHQQQEELLQPQYRPSPQNHRHEGQGPMGHGRRIPPYVPDSGYTSDVEGSPVAPGRTVWRRAGVNVSSCTTSPLRSDKAAVRSQSPSAVPLPTPQYAQVEQPPEQLMQLQEPEEQQTQERIPQQPPFSPQQQEQQTVGDEGVAPGIMVAQVNSTPSSPPQLFDPSVGPVASDGTERADQIEFVQTIGQSSPGLLAMPMRTSVDGLGGPTGLLAADGKDFSSGAMAERSQLHSAIVSQARNPEPTVAISRNPSFNPNLNGSPSPSLCTSPILGLTSKPPQSPGRVRVMSPEGQRSPRAPSPGYVTAAVRAAEAAGEEHGNGIDEGDIRGSADSRTGIRPATVTIGDISDVKKGRTGAVAQLGRASPDGAAAGNSTAAAAAAAVAAAAAGAPLLALPARPIGVPSRRAPLGTQRPASPYIPFSAVDPASDAAVVARGGSPPPHTGPPGTAGTVSHVPKLVACNYGYLQIIPKSRARSRNGSAAQRDGTGDGSGASTGPEIAVTVLRNNGTSGGYSRSQSANAFLESTAGLLHFASRPASMTPGSATGSSSVAGAVCGVSQSATDLIIEGGADGRAGNRWSPGSGRVSPTSPKTPSWIRVSAGGPVTINASLVGRQCSPPSPPATAAASIAAGSSSGGGAAGSGNRISPSRRRGPSWQDLGSQRAAEQYAASLPLGLMSVSFSTAGLSRVPPLQRLLYLESLALSYNHLVGLASEQIIGLSQNLKVLTLVSADLDELPPDMGLLLPGLVELNLCSNRLVSLPLTIGSMTRLRSLSIAHNQLTSLPSSLYTLATLEHLFLQYNRLTVIDEALGNLRQLQALYLGFNRIAQLPNETTALGSCLTRLVMPYNQLQALPPGFLLSMTHLAVLVLDFNPHLAADPQLGGGRGSSKSVSSADTASEAATGDAIRSRSPNRLTLSSFPSRGTAAGGAGGAGGTAAFGPGVESPGAEHSMGTELSFAPVPEPTAPSLSGTTLGGTSRSVGSLQEGLSVTTSMIVASTTALSNLLKASAAPGAAVPMPMSPLPPTPTSPAPSGGPMAPQMLPALRVLSLSAVQLLQVPSWLPAGLQVLDLSRNNLRRLPSWLCRRLAPSLAVLRLHTNRLESLPSEIRTMSQLQLLSLEENPIASPERIATSQGAGWAAEWLYRKKYRSRPEILASLATEHTGLTGPVSGLPGSASTANFAAASTESSAITAGGFGGGGTATSKAGSAATASVAASSLGGMAHTRSLHKGMMAGSNAAA